MIISPVTFFISDKNDIPDFHKLDPDRDWEIFMVGGEVGWVLQTYLRLRSAGHPVRLSSKVPKDGIVLFHRNAEFPYFSKPVFTRLPFTITVNADLGEFPWADTQIIQDPSKKLLEREFYVPYWPQPGLIQRDASRGPLIRKVAFKGNPRRLDGSFLTGAWGDFLKNRKIEWDYDVRIMNEDGSLKYPVRWNNYKDVDLIVAVSNLEYPSHVHKPPNKLINAWLAGTPAILGPEPAFRNLRKSELDYIEVSSCEEAKAAVDRLRINPALYQSMVENGKLRAEGYQVDQIVNRWAEILYKEVPCVAGSLTSRFLRLLPLRIRRKIWNTIRPYRWV